MVSKLLVGVWRCVEVSLSKAPPPNLTSWLSPCLVDSAVTVWMNRWSGWVLVSAKCPQCKCQMVTYLFSSGQRKGQWSVLHFGHVSSSRLSYLDPTNHAAPRWRKRPCGFKLNNEWLFNGQHFIAETLKWIFCLSHLGLSEMSKWTMHGQSICGLNQLNTFKCIHFPVVHYGGVRETGTSTGWSNRHVGSKERHRRTALKNKLC